MNINFNFQARMTNQTTGTPSENLKKTQDREQKRDGRIIIYDPYTDDDEEKSRIFMVKDSVQIGNSE